MIMRPDPDRLKPLITRTYNSDSLKRALGMFIHDAKKIPRFSEIFHPFTDFKSFPIVSEASKAFKTMKAVISNSSYR